MSKNLIYVYNQGSDNVKNKNIDSNILSIADYWFELSNSHHIRNKMEVVGSKFVFDYLGDEYHLFSQSPNNYEESFKSYINLILEMLVDIGATNITYRVGKPV